VGVFTEANEVNEAKHADKPLTPTLSPSDEALLEPFQFQRLEKLLKQLCV
jgi:hypothetical protein